jgi:hypothetical protein
VNFADDSACLTANNVQEEVVTIHGSQEVVENAVPLHVDIVQK